MLILRLGPLIIHHYNLLLAAGLILSLFIIYRLAKRNDYDVEKVLDWALWGIMVSVLAVWLTGKFVGWLAWRPQLNAIRQFSLFSQPFLFWWGKFVALNYGSFGPELGVLAFVIYSKLLFKKWRWQVFPPLDFAAVGGFFFYLTAAASLSWGNWLSDWALKFLTVPVWLFNFFFFGTAFFLLVIFNRRRYKPRRALAAAFLFTLRPLLVLTGAIFFVILEQSDLITLMANIFKGLAKVGRLRFKKTKQEEVTEKKLEKEAAELKHRLGELEEEQDPSARPERVAENAMEEDADEAEGGARFAALKTVFARRLREVSTALRKMKKGSYGLCDRCGRQIDPARLKAKPDARYCLDCAKELEDLGRG